ncbi:28735_t:CDS:2, partial [Dentiscutata erythropus]
MDCKCKTNSSLFRECCYQKYIYKPKLFKDPNSEYYNYLLINIAKLNSQTKNRDYEKLKEKIKNTFDLNLLKTKVQRYNNLREKINAETNIEQLRDLQYWHQQITIDAILPNNLKEQLNNIHKEQVNRYWYREIQQSKNLLKSQRIELNILRDETLKKLSNKYYDEEHVQDLSNDSDLAIAINNFNQTLLDEDQNKNQLIDTRKNQYNNLFYDLIECSMRQEEDKQSLADGEKYNLLIQTLEQEYLEEPHISIFSEAFKSLLNDVILKEK